MYRILSFVFLFFLFSNTVFATDIADSNGSVALRVTTGPVIRSSETWVDIQTTATRASTTNPITKVGIVWRKAGDSGTPAQQSTSISSGDGFGTREFRLRNLQCATEYTATAFVDFRKKDGTNAVFQYGNTVTFSTPACNSENTTRLTIAAPTQRITETSAIFTVEIENGSSVGLSSRVQYKKESDTEYTTVNPNLPIITFPRQSNTTETPNRVRTEVEIRNLEPATKYQYRVEGTFTRPQNSTTPLPSPNPTYSSVGTFTTTGEQPEPDPDPEPEPTTGDNTYQFLTPLPIGEGFEEQSNIEIGGDGIAGIFQQAFTLLLVVVVVLAVVFLIIGGARYATADALGGVQGGRQIITNAIVGLLFALLSWLLLNTINPDLVRFNLTIPNIAGKATGSGGGNTGGGNTGDFTMDAQKIASIIRDAKSVGLEAQYEINTSAAEAQRLNTEVLRILGDPNITCHNDRGLCVLHVAGATAPHFSIYNDNRPGNKQCTKDNYRTECTRLPNTIPTNGRTCCTIDGFNGGRCNGDRTSGTQCYLEKNTQQKLVALQNKQSGLRITEAWPPSFNGHADTPCHQYGYCVDATFGSGSGSTGTGAPVSGIEVFQFPYINITGHVQSAEKNRRIKTPDQISRLVRSLNSQTRSLIETAARQNRVDPKLFTALILVESGGNPNIGSSSAGACGIAQMLPGTAKTLDASLRNLSDQEVCDRLRTNTSFALNLGARYLASFSSSSLNNQLASYNGGPGATGASNDCPGRKRYECLWDAPGYYNPNGNPLKALESMSHLNTGYAETRYYIINIRNIMGQL